MYSGKDTDTMESKHLKQTEMEKDVSGVWDTT